MLLLVPQLQYIENQHLYEYFSLESLPICDDTIRARMASSNKPIVVFGYDEPEVSEALKNHGYDLSKAKYNGNLALADMTEEQSLSTEINCKVDSLLQRLALKNLFNYNFNEKFYKFFPLNFC